MSCKQCGGRQQSIKRKVKSDHIFWKQTKIDKEDRQKLNGHQSFVLWFTGLSGSGKSTIAAELERKLYQRKMRTFILDGDNIRHGLNSNLGFSPEDRTENIRRIGEVSRLLMEAGLIVLTACISPYMEDRERVRNLFKPGEFIEIYVKCSLEVCERRDPKGLYQKARAGIIPHFTGLSDPYEAPQNPEIIIESDKQSVREAVDQIMGFLSKSGKLDF